MVRDHEEIERAFQLRFHAARRGYLLAAGKAQCLFGTKLYTKAKGVDGIGSVHMGIAPQHHIGGTGGHFDVRRRLRHAGVVHDTFFAILHPPISETRTNGDNSDGTQYNLAYSGHFTFPQRRDAAEKPVGQDAPK